MPLVTRTLLIIASRMLSHSSASSCNSTPHGSGWVWCNVAMPTPMTMRKMRLVIAQEAFSMPKATEAARTLDEDVKRLRDLNDPPRTWQRELANLSALVIFVVAIVLFTMKDEIN